MARTKLSEEDRRAGYLRVRMRRNELAALARAAKREGLKLSAWVRAKLLAGTA